MRRKHHWIGLVACIAIILTGCWDRRELNDLAITVGMGLDRKGDQITLTEQIVNPGEVVSKGGAGGYTTPVISFKATEATITEAIRKLSTETPRQIFSSHLRIVVIGEELARQGLSRVLDGMSRNHEFRSDFYIIVAKGAKAEDVLEVLTPLEKIPANKLFETLENAEKLWAPTAKIQLDKFISEVSNPTKSTILPGVLIVGDKEKGETSQDMNRMVPDVLLKYSSAALIKHGKLVDWLNEEESKGYNYIRGNVKQTASHYSCPDSGTVAVKVVRSKTKTKGKVVNGKPQVNVNLYVEQDISEVQCGIDLTKQENIKELEELGEKKLIELMEAAIKKAKKNKADIFGFGDVIEDADPKSWTEMKKDWDRQFAQMDVTIHADVQIHRMGTTSNSMVHQQEEGS